MGRYPKRARGARVKCISCNAPATETVDETVVCVECGDPVCEPHATRQEAAGD